MCEDGDKKDSECGSAVEPQLFDLLQLTGDLAKQAVDQEATDLAEEARRKRVLQAQRDRKRA